MTIARRFQRSVVEVLVVWSISCLFISPYMYYLRIVKTSKGDFCYDVWELKTKFIYYAIMQSVSCFLAVIIMVIVYSLSALRIYRHVMPGDNKKAECRRLKQNKSITRMFGRVVLVFFALTTPNAIQFFVQAYIGTFREDVFIREYEKIFYIAQILYAVSSINCCVNPIIYARMHKNMRKSFNKRVSWLFRRPMTFSGRDFNSNAHLRSTQTTFTNRSTREN